MYLTHNAMNYDEQEQSQLFNLCFFVVVFIIEQVSSLSWGKANKRSYDSFCAGFSRETNVFFCEQTGEILRAFMLTKAYEQTANNSKFFVSFTKTTN
ncbi:CLUMA_CG012237, isoform A [Clunio marinus]|uniref:CLUMA_CG012237, isoform A n=1 Tax=Clunio marinus TaxID=568069 RepID=A0A1J1IFQ6_9DIPT|nr:CLUMA_CG012237, isoform A [Clunio marinus]